MTTELSLIEAVFNKDGQAMTNSKKVAEFFSKEHYHVMRDISDLDCSKEFNQSNFGAVTYRDNKGEERPMFNMTRNGFIFLAMGYTGAKAALVKEKYIEAFDRMEQTLRNGTNPNRVPNEFPQYVEKVNITKVTSSLIEETIKLAKLLGNDESHARAYAVSYTAKEIPEFPHRELLLQNKSSEIDYLEKVTNIGASFNPVIKNQEVNKILESLGLQYRNPVTGKWEPTPLAKELNMCGFIPQSTNNNSVVDNLRWYYNKTIDYLIEKKNLTKKIIAKEVKHA